MKILYLIIIVGVGVAPFLWFLDNQNLIDRQFAITLVIAELPIGVLLHIITREKNKHSDIDIGAKLEKETAYFQHLKDDVVSVLESQVTEKQPSYTMALFSLPFENREMILSHFCTAEKSSKKYHGLYTNIKKISNIEHEIDIKNKKLMDFINNINKGLRNISEKNDKDVTDYFYSGFDTGLGVFLDIELYNYKKIEEVHKNLMVYKLESRFEDNHHVLYFNNNSIVKSKKQETIWKFSDYLYKQIPILKNLLDDSRRAIHADRLSEIVVYNQLIKNNFEAIKRGIPEVGVCKACVGYFPDSQKKKLDKMLDKCFKNFLKSS